MQEITTDNLKLAGNLSSVKIRIIILISHPSMSLLIIDKVIITYEIR